MAVSRFWFVLSALVVGLGSAWAVVRFGGEQTAQAGAWRSEVLAGSVAAGPYTRARVAVGGLLALGPSETLYFVAEKDDAGRPLRTTCSYRVSGPVPDARWWSVTAYGADHFLLPAPDHRYSVNSAAGGMAGGEVSFVTGPQRPSLQDSSAGTAAALATAATPWLPTPGDTGLLLVLRLYQPGAALRRNAGALLPLHISALGRCP